MHKYMSRLFKCVTIIFKYINNIKNTCSKEDDVSDTRTSIRAFMTDVSYAVLNAYKTRPPCTYTASKDDWEMTGGT